MGACISQPTPEEREAKSRSSAIDRNLRQDAKEFENTIKILLLGMSFELFMCAFSHVLLLLCDVQELVNQARVH